MLLVEQIGQFLIAFGLSFLGAAVLGLLLWKPAINLWTDAFVKRLLKDPYPENIGEMYNVFAKVGVRNVLEADLRGNTGGPLERPFGSPLHLSNWDRLMLNPVYLSRLPINEAVAIDTQVTIGPFAERPLTIALPIMIAGMGYGFGPSYQAKLALARAADQVNTATNTGVGPFLPEERKNVKRLILQYHRGQWSKDPKVLRQADMIEIQLGYGALGSAPVDLSTAHISPEFRKFMNLKPGEGLKLSAQFPEVHNGAELAELVQNLKKISNGVPVGVKLGATQCLERELEIITGASVDFLAIDGAEAGINFGPAILADDVGLPTLPALCRTVEFLKQKQLKDRISVIVSGGMVTPGQVLKALALGADAVYMGTVLMIVLAHQQITAAIPWEPPTELVYERGKLKDKLSVEAGAESVANFLRSCREEMILAMRSLGRTSIKELSRDDLCAIHPETARITGVESGLFPPGK